MHVSEGNQQRHSANNQTKNNYNCLSYFVIQYEEVKIA